MNQPQNIHGLPERQGLYDPRNEHDACGMGFVVNLNGHRSHDIIRKGAAKIVRRTAVISELGAGFWARCDPTPPRRVIDQRVR